MSGARGNGETRACSFGATPERRTAAYTVCHAWPPSPACHTYQLVILVMRYRRHYPPLPAITLPQSAWEEQFDHHKATRTPRTASSFRVVDHPRTSPLPPLTLASCPRPAPCSICAQSLQWQYLRRVSHDPAPCFSLCASPGTPHICLSSAGDAGVAGQPSLHKTWGDGVGCCRAIRASRRVAVLGTRPSG